ncbi:MAG: FecR domain-containing protein [Chitinophagaceae bacterium]
MEQIQFTYLFHRYFSKQSTPEETEAFFTYLRSAENDDELKKLILQTWEAEIPNYHQDERNADAIFHAIIGKSKVRTLGLWSRIAVAAAIIIFVGAGIAIYLSKDNLPSIATNKPADVNPGGYKAKLTLADGRIIILDSAIAGQLATQGKTVITNKDGQLVYDAGKVSGQVSPTGGDLEGAYNILSTSKGETYGTVLSDGSKVLLNSASSIKFPVSFTGKERKVEITGEAYFEVAPLSPKGGQGKVPFIVSANGITTEVLGTHFNINSYADEEATKVTLLEGSVKVVPFSTSGEGKGLRLKPGQQAVLTNDSRLITLAPDLNEVIAWKQGLFHFESADLKTILRQYARWYDIEVIYEGPVSNEKYFSIMSRNTTLSNVLKSLQANDIQFRIEGRKLYVGKG